MAKFLTVAQLSITALAASRGGLNDAKIEYISNREMYDMFHLKGGLSVISNKLCYANTPGTSTFDPEKPTSYSKAFDATSLYPSTMPKYKFPTGEYHWEENPEQWAEENILAIDIFGDFHYQFNIDIMLPDELHDGFNTQWPLLLDQRKVSDTELSARQLSYRPDGTASTTKLVADLIPKKNYRVGAPLLQFMLKRGYKITKVH